MYLHIGKDTVVKKSDIIAVFDLDISSQAFLTRDYLRQAEKSGAVINVADDLPKSFVVCGADGGKQVVYLSQLNSATLFKRSESFDLSI